MPEDWLSWQARTITLGTVADLLQHVFHTHIKMAHEYKLFYFQEFLLFHLKQLHSAKVWQFLRSLPVLDSKRVKLLSNLETICCWTAIRLQKKTLKRMNMRPYLKKPLLLTSSQVLVPKNVTVSHYHVMYSYCVLILLKSTGFLCSVHIISVPSGIRT